MAIVAGAEKIKVLIELPDMKDVSFHHQVQVLCTTGQEWTLTHCCVLDWLMSLHANGRAGSLSTGPMPSTLL